MPLPNVPSAADAVCSGSPVPGSALLSFDTASSATALAHEHAVASHSWVEATHCFYYDWAEHTHGGSPMWWFVAPGSGLWLNVGRTVVLDTVQCTQGAQQPLGTKGSPSALLATAPDAYQAAQRFDTRPDTR